jgi:DNA polymerase III subunit gamma/tau
MDKFVVSARKYRPQTFDTVIGQQHITTTLKNAIVNNQLAHAFLFTGPRGVGKTTCARILAKTINCTNLQPNGEACQKCDSCVSFDSGGSLNIHELDAASNNSVDDMRSLTEQVRFAPQAGDYKIYIIDEVHMLTSAAFNAFLKTLEEPPSYAKFILATTEKHKILPTILSRCQIFDFKRITAKDIVEHLEHIGTQETVKATPEALHLIARKSEGCMRDALSIYDKITSFTGGVINYENALEHLNVLDEETFFTILDHMQQQNLPAIMTLFDKINAKGFEGDVFLNGFAEFYRNLLFAYHPDTLALLEVADAFRKKYLATSAAVSINQVLNGLAIISKAETEYKAAKNKKLFVEMTLVKLCYLQQAMEITPANNNVVAKKAPSTPVLYKPIKTWGKSVALPPTQEAVLEIQPSAKVANSISAQPVLPTIPKINTVAAPNIPIIKEAASPVTMGALEKIKQKIKKEQAERTWLPVTQENIEAVWSKIAEALKAQQKLSTASILSLATIFYDASINQLVVNASSVLQQNSIYQESLLINESLKEVFGPNKPLWQLVILENEVAPTENNAVDEKKLSKKEQYEEMVKLYPLIKKLREDLKLDLDY